MRSSLGVGVIIEAVGTRLGIALLVEDQFSVVRSQFSESNKDSPEPPEAVLVPSRLEGHVNGVRLAGKCCRMIAD